MCDSPPPPEDRPYLRAVDRTDRQLGKYELTSFFATPGALEAFIDEVVAHYHDKIPIIDAVVGLDALGLPLAGALGFAMRRPVIVARKGGKISLPPDEVLGTGRFGDHLDVPPGAQDKSLEIRRDLLKHGMKVIVVDEWIDSGAQMTAIVRLLESVAVQVVGIATLQLRRGRSEMADALLQYDLFAANGLE